MIKHALSRTFRKNTISARLLLAAVLAMSLAGLAACGGGMENEPVIGGGPNTLRMMGSQADLHYPGAGGGKVEHVVCTGYDADGNVVYRSGEESYDGDITFSGIPDKTVKVQIDYNRGTGYTLARHVQEVNFAAGKDGVFTLSAITPVALGDDRDTLTVRIVNRSPYPDDKVFITVYGKNIKDNAYNYLAFGKDGNAVASEFEPVNPDKIDDPKAEMYSVALNQLTNAGKDPDDKEKTIYSFQCPYKNNLVSGRIVFAFGKKLLGLGLTNSADKLSIREPSSTGAPDYQTLFEFMELSVTRQDPTKAVPNPPYVLFINTSVVDFFSIGMQMSVEVQKPGKNAVTKTVGFPDGARKDVFAAFKKAEGDDSLKKFCDYIQVEDKDKKKQKLRIMAPHQEIAVNSGPDACKGINSKSALFDYLDVVIDEGWKNYSKKPLTIDDSVRVPPKNDIYAYGFRYKPELITAEGILKMTCVAWPENECGVDANGKPIRCPFPSDNEICSLPKITTREVFDCDDICYGQRDPRPDFNDSYKNEGSNGHKRLVALIAAALNRGVFENYADWGNPDKYYKRADKKYNFYSKVMHDNALEVADEKYPDYKVRRVYAFGYDDIYGQDPTIAADVPTVNNVTITIPKFDLNVDTESQVSANIRSTLGKRTTLYVALGAGALAIGLIVVVNIIRRRRAA